LRAHHTNSIAAGKPSSRRLFVYNGGFLTQQRTRRILQLSGYKIRLGLPKPDDLIGVWGHSPTARRGEAVAAKRGTSILRVEDAFLRSLFPGRSGSPALGLCLDHGGMHYDPAQMSDLEQLLTHDPLDNSDLLNRSRDAVERIKEMHLSKYSAFHPDLTPPKPGYVLVIDQTLNDASVRASKATRAHFLEMLVMAQEEHPGARVLIKTHPETVQGQRAGYFTHDDESDRVKLYAEPISPWVLFEGAIGVYTVSSHIGFEAIFAGHKPGVFGQPFYNGWGLTDDERPVPRRQRKLTRAQLFAAAMILYPVWYDAYGDKICTLEEALDRFEAETLAWRMDHRGWSAYGMRLWKRKPLQQVFGRYAPVQFDQEGADRPTMIWASKQAHTGLRHDIHRVEDGFLRSRGLGAELVPPLSLVVDDLGIYYDPAKPSRLEHLITSRATLRRDQRLRAERLITSLIRLGVSKYNLGGTVPTLPEGRRILVPGQVEDDASILTGTDEITTNLALLQAVRADNPDAVILYKPHPDVEAGLRIGAVPQAADIADMVLDHTDLAQLLDQVDEVCTMTSLTGFEALIRGKKVTTYGAPFYAGWGLTTDKGRVPLRRQARPDLASLVHATLIDYPRYFDPVTRQICPVEIAVTRLSSGNIPHPGIANRLLAKLQGVFASYSRFWR
jgi:capsular polysaccharide export protein